MSASVVTVVASRYVTRVVLHNLLSQTAGVDVRIYLGGVDSFVAQQFLNYTQVGPALKQSRGKRVAQRVRTYGLCYAGSLSQALYRYQHHGPCEMLSYTAYEYVVLLTWLGQELSTPLHPRQQLAHSPARHRHKTLLRPLAQHSYVAFGHENIRKLQRHKLAHTQPARKQHLYHGPVPHPFGLRRVGGILHHVHLFGRKNLGQMLTCLG